MQTRVNSTLTKLNQGVNTSYGSAKFTMNIPKVIQINEREYQNYAPEEEGVDASYN